MPEFRAPFSFAITQPPGETQVAGGQADNLDDALREGGHYHRVYTQDGRARLTVTDAHGEILLMATAGNFNGSDDERT